MVPKNNYGGRNGKTANDAVMLKYLTLSTYQMQRRNFAFSDCDTTDCYDQILPHMLSMIYEKMSLPQQTCHWLIRALVKIQYHMQTMHGIYERVSQSDEQGAIFGIGQGATDTPDGWLLVSTILSKMYDKIATGCTLQDLLNNTIVK